VAKRRLGKERDFVDSAFDAAPVAAPVVNDPMDVIIENNKDGTDMEGVMQAEKKASDIAVLLDSAPKKVVKDGWLLDVSHADMAAFEAQGVLVGLDMQPNGLYSVKVK